jgi:hypothetical protein
MTQAKNEDDGHDLRKYIHLLTEPKLVTLMKCPAPRPPFKQKSNEWQRTVTREE